MLLRGKAASVWLLHAACSAQAARGSPERAQEDRARASDCSAALPIASLPGVGERPQRRGGPALRGRAAARRS
jgi:hypothetical protein